MSEPTTIHGLIIDSFAGGGGASLGIEMATGRSPDVAVNHDAWAIAMHAANHPSTWHLTENIWQVDPDMVLRQMAGRAGRPIPINPRTRLPHVAHLHASPDCRHHSKAKGGAPVSRAVRGLADVILVWARVAQPDVITLENVEEFEDWGPLGDDGRPDPARKGEEFRRWARTLTRLGYKGDWRTLRACDYGAPTIRRRLYAVFRRDGLPIFWPKPTHGRPDDPEILAGRLKPWRTAAEIIDWSLPCPSIFLTRPEAKAQGLNVVRPLADKTMARIARGFKRHVLDRADPFVVTVNHSGDGFRGQGLADPFKTVTSSRDAHGLVTPFVSYAQQGGNSRPADAPLHTVCASSKDQNQIIAPFLAVNRFEQTGQVIDAPLPTITANSFIKRPGAGGPLSIAACYLAQHNGGERGPIGRPADEPAATLATAGAQVQPVMGFLASLQNNTARGACNEPVGTVLAAGNHHTLIAPFVTSYYSEGGQDSAADAPMPTVPTRARFSPITPEVFLPPLTPSMAERALQVAAFLRAHSVWDGPGEFVTLGDFIVWDIGMRMLTPRELARAQGFPESYDITAGGKLTETAQRHKIGNSVCPDVMAAIVRANMVDMAGLKSTHRRIGPEPRLADVPPLMFAAE